VILVFMESYNHTLNRFELLPMMSDGLITYLKACSFTEVELMLRFRLRKASFISFHADIIDGVSILNPS
jgi:hypothetical protein